MSHAALRRSRRARVAALGGLAALTFTGLAGTANANATARPAARGVFSKAHDRFVSSTIDPATGDDNPYGVTVVPVTSGSLVRNDVLVSDFNNFGGTGGAGTSIVQIDPSTGAVSDFAHGGSIAGPDSLTFNPKGFLWVGDLGAPNSSGVDSGANGNVAIVSPTGAVSVTFDRMTTGHGFFAGTWGQEYGMNVAGKVSFYWPDAGTGSDAGTVWRLDPNPSGPPNGQPTNATYALIAKLPAGGPTATVPTVRGPQGEAYDAATDTLYVADDAANEIVAIPHASMASGPQKVPVVLKGGPLHAPQGIVLDPATKTLLVVNGATNNDVIDVTTSGRVIGVDNVAPNEPAGALFGLAVDPTGTTKHRTALYYVNDDENSLHLLTFSNRP